MPSSSTSAVIKLTIEQQRHHDRLILGVGDGYAYLAQRLKEADDLATYEELDQRFTAAANIFEQAAVVQEFQKKIGCR